MTYEDYLIHSSELQHAFWTKKRPKYFKKYNGRYFYSKQEWEAFVNKVRKKLDKAVTRFKKDVTKQFKSYQKSARKAQKQRSIERMERSRKFKQGLVDTKYAIQEFSKNASKKMSDLKASASKQISRGKEFAALCFANVRGQMNRFNDKVVKPGMENLKKNVIRPGLIKAKDAIDRIKYNAPKKISIIRDTVPDIISAGFNIVKASFMIPINKRRFENADAKLDAARENMWKIEDENRRSGPPTKAQQAEIDEAKKRVSEMVNKYIDAESASKLSRTELEIAREQFQENLDELLDEFLRR